jgi:hypothetical protein
LRTLVLVRASGGRAVGWKGRYHRVDRPEALAANDAVMSAFFNGFEGAIMSGLGIARWRRHRTSSVSTGRPRADRPSAGIRT